MKKGRYAILLTILILSMYLNIENMVSIFLADMSAAFPNASLVSVQKVYSFIYLVQVFVQFLVGWFASKLSKRKIIIYFQGFTVAGGLFAFFFGKTIGLLYASSIMIGFAAAIISTISKSIITENFDAEKVPKVLAMQMIAQGLGTMMLQMLTGYLAAIKWNFGYLSFLFGLVSLLTAIFLLPEGPVEKHEANEQGIVPKVWTKALIHDVLIQLLFIAIFTTYFSNISYLVKEKGFGNAAAVGYLSSLLTAFTLVAGVFFTKFLKLTGKWIAPVSFSIIIIGFFIITRSTNIWMALIGVAISGFGQGNFTPSIYLSVSRHADPSRVTSSIAMLNAFGSAGTYLYPYLITIPASLFGKTAATRFTFAAVILLAVTVFEIIYHMRIKAPNNN